MTSVPMSPAVHVTIADTAQSAVNVRDPDQRRRQKPRDPDYQNEDSRALKGHRGQQQVRKDDNREQNKSGQSSTSRKQSFFATQLATSLLHD